MASGNAAPHSLRLLSFAPLPPLLFLLLHVSGPCPAQSVFQQLLVSEDPDLEGAPAVLGARGGPALIPPASVPGQGGVGGVCGARSVKTSDSPSQ